MREGKISDRIEPGTYRGFIESGELEHSRWGPRLWLHFVLTHNSADKPLPRELRVDRIYPLKADDTGRIIINERGTYFTDWVRLAGYYPGEGELPAPEALYGMTADVEVEYSKLDSKKKVKPEAEWVSRVSRIIRAYKELE